MSKTPLELTIILYDLNMSKDNTLQTLKQCFVEVEEDSFEANIQLEECTNCIEQIYK